jgi:glutathione S-transferase
MTDDLVFHTNPMSRGRIVRWMLEETGAPYRTEVLAYGPEMRSTAFLAINPLGKVPAITHRGAVVTECAAICAYLADAFPEAGLASAPADRADYYRWMFFASGPLEAAIINARLGFEAPDNMRGSIGYVDMPTMLDALEAAVSRTDHIAGDAFSAADVYVGSQIGWGLQFGTIEDRTAFRTYWDRISARPAHVRATEIDNAAMGAPPRLPPTARRFSSFRWLATA